MPLRCTRGSYLRIRLLDTLRDRFILIMDTVEEGFAQLDINA